MPPQLQQLLENKKMLAIVGGAVALVIVLIIVFVVMGSGKKEGSESRKLTPEEIVLATVDSAGRAIEIQALMAREGVNLIREDAEGGLFSLKFEKSATLDDRDRALVTLVQSGLMDKNVGLELFDKGDLTASREEKRIKLIRARNGELARLIRKIDPIQDAAVFISMPEPTIFKRDMVPPSATVQITLAPGERLSRDKVRSIINLLVGSIENLTASHVSLTDTNGNVYNSVLDAQDEMMSRLEERDRYMESKVKTQLDRLLGQGKYSVTVSTYLREAPKAELSLNYDPQRSSVSKSAAFTENLNANQKGSGMAGGPVSSFIPDEVDVNAAGSEQSQRGYNRNGQEVEYNTGKKQVSEDFVPGMIEEITVAVTVDPDAYPGSMGLEELQGLIARAASPMVNPENVTIATGRDQEVSPVTPQQQQAKEAEIPWWIWAVGSAVVFILFLLIMRALSKPSQSPMEMQQFQQHQMELQQLRELAETQAQQIQMTQQQAQQMLQQQQQQLAQLTSQQQQQPIQAAANTGALELKQTLTELQKALQREEYDEDEELGTEIKSWIEST